MVSTDHADEKLCAEDLLDREDEMRSISVDEVEKHNGKDKKSFWAVVDGMRVVVMMVCCGDMAVCCGDGHVLW